MSESSPSPIDPELRAASFDAGRLLELVDGDKGLLREMNDLLWEDVPTWLETIDDSLDNEDGETLINAAHALKGALSNFAADRATAMAAELEELGRQRHLAEASARSDELRRELDVLSTELERFVED